MQQEQNKKNHHNEYKIQFSKTFNSERHANGGRGRCRASIRTWWRDGALPCTAPWRSDVCWRPSPCSACTGASALRCALWWAPGTLRRRVLFSVWCCNDSNDKHNHRHHNNNETNDLTRAHTTGH